MRTRELLAAAAVVFGAFALRGAAPPRMDAVKGAEQRARAMSGRDLYVSYCASCHGMEGKGDGPAAEAMRMRPTDLTKLAQKHGGQFPVLRVQGLLRGLEGFPAHGGKRMPVWGPVFLPVSPAEGEAAALVDRLVRYLESIQARAGER